MPCSHCPEPPVVELRYAGTRLCRKHFLESFDRRAKAELSRQGGLPEGTIAVALSGGKDSLSVLHFLGRITKGHPRMKLHAITVDEGIQGYRDSSLEICRRMTTDWGVPWTVVKTEAIAGYTIDAYAAGVAGPKGETLPVAARPSCGACGVFRRAGLNRLAASLGAAAVVTGHNLDDQAQSILMNHLRGDLDRLARLAPHEGSPDGFVARRLPFGSIPEKEVLLYAVLHGLPLHEEECPYAVRSHRFALREVLMGLEAAHPGTRHALAKGQARLKPLLVAGLGLPEPATCSRCGDVATGDVCMACQLAA
ncbi:MAG: TIGR00269 family protein [Thermoplasmatota archaeon]